MARLVKTHTGNDRLRAWACLAVATLLCLALSPLPAWGAEDLSAAAEAAEAAEAPVEEPAAPETEAAAAQLGDDASEDADPEAVSEPGSSDIQATSDEAAGDSSVVPGADGEAQTGSAAGAGLASGEASLVTSSSVKAALRRAARGIDSSNAAMGGLPGALSGVRSAKAAYDAAQDEVDALSDEYEDLEAVADGARARADLMRPASQAAQRQVEMMDEVDPWTYAIKTGMSLLEARTYEDRLRAIAEGAGAAADAAEEEYDQAAKRASALLTRIESRRAEATDALALANARAAEAEIACSEARSGEVDASEALDGLSGSIDEVRQMRASVESVTDAHRLQRFGAYAALDEWYDDLDRRAGADTARLTFGTGREFMLSEKEFVAKWGAAIDAYYEELGGTPLSGYGETMAREAWEWKIDPRLCAAVSFTESAGGRLCIRHCNAWGWGAADSDPYNLASEWGSWEEAIAAWHRGMATNTMGLATARSVDELGNSYASAPHWSSNVATAMARISELAGSRPVVVQTLTISHP